MSGRFTAFLLIGVLLAGLPAASADESMPVQVTVTAAPATDDVISHTFEFECQAVQAMPTLRIAFGKFREFSISAGQQLVPGQKEQTAVGTVVVTARKNEGDTFTIALELGPDGPLTASRTMPLPQGQSLTDAVTLTSENQSAPTRRSVRLGQVAGAAISAYVMPGRIPTSNTAKAAAAAPEADGAPVAMFESWAKGVKAGDLALFAQGYAGPQWGRWNDAEKEKRLSQYQQAFETVLGKDYDPAKFKAEYKGGVAKGTLHITYEDETLPELPVRRYGSRWILADE